MPIAVGWDNTSQQIICCSFAETWTWNDVFAMNCEIENMMETVNHDVCVVITMQTDVFPKSGTLTYTKHLFIHKHSNYANHVIFVNGSVLIKTFERIIRKAYVQSMRDIRSDYVDSLEHARQLIRIKS